MLLYHTRTLNSPLLVAINTLGTDQASTTGNRIIALIQLLDYCAIYPNSTLRFVASDMVLRIYSNASYLSVSKIHSRTVGFFNLSSDGDTPTFKWYCPCLVRRLKKKLWYLSPSQKLVTFIKMSHLHPAPPNHVDNEYIVGIINKTLRQ